MAACVTSSSCTHILSFPTTGIPDGVEFESRLALVASLRASPIGIDYFTSHSTATTTAATMRQRARQQRRQRAVGQCSTEPRPLRSFCDNIILPIANSHKAGNPLPPAWLTADTPAPSQDELTVQHVLKVVRSDASITRAAAQ